MADLTYDVALQYLNLSKNPIPFVIKNGEQLYAGMLCGLSGGYIQKHAAAGDACIEGIAVEGGVPGSDPNMDAIVGSNVFAPGNTGSSPPPRAIIERGKVVVRQVTIVVAGTLAGTQADVGKELYCATSNIADASTTQTGADKKLGKIVWWYSAAGGNEVVDIEVYDADTRKDAG